MIYTYDVIQLGKFAPRVLKMSNEGDTIIIFRSFDQIGISWNVVYDAPKLLTDRHISVLLSDAKRLSKRHVYTKIMAENLSSSYLGRVSQDLFLKKYLRWLKRPFRGCLLLFLYLICEFVTGDVTLSLWGWHTTLCHQYIIDRATLFKPIPATKLSVQGLEKLMPDSLDATVRDTPCAICKEALDHFVAVEVGTDHQPEIRRLPCSHMYHGDCINLWLDINHFCPVCRYSLPVEEAVGEPSRPSGKRRPDLPRIMISAAGMITATLLHRLIKRS